MLRAQGTEQALADAAFFVRQMTSAYNLTSASRWISFGGSYSGELAAWVRIKCVLQPAEMLPMTLLGSSWR